MLSIDQIVDYLRRLIGEQRLAGDREGLWNTQRVAGMLMEAAQSAADRETAYSFRVIAAEAANKIEELDREV